jgi:hypothetical protein
VTIPASGFGGISLEKHFFFGDQFHQLLSIGQLRANLQGTARIMSCEGSSVNERCALTFKKIVLQYQAHGPILARSTHRPARIVRYLLGNHIWVSGPS